MSTTEKMEKTSDTKVDVKPEHVSAVERRVERQPRRWDPFDLFNDLQDEMSRLWGHTWPMMPRAFTRPQRWMGMGPMQWTPSVDMYEKDNMLVVKAELPGMKKEDIDVSMDQGDLVIRGERAGESEIKEEHYYRSERSYGRFYRRIPLPADVQAEQIKASYRDGLLEVQVPKPKQEQPQARKIPLT